MDDRVYTFPEVVELVQRHADLLEGAGRALVATDHRDEGILEFSRKEALAAARDLWDVENTAGHELTERGWPGAIHEGMFTLPLVASSLELALENGTDVTVAHAGPAMWARDGLEDVARILREWLAEHRTALEEGAALTT